jgi:NTE family protein
MASAAIPIFFPPVKIKGTYFGDGCLRNNAPISPAIHLGAEKVIVVGIRKEPSIADSVKKAHQMPTIGRLSNILLDSVFMDGIDFDLERLNRINNTVMQAGEQTQESTNLKPIDFVYIQPSKDIGEIAKVHAEKLPKIVNFTLQRMGSIDDAADIVSYLLFDSEFCSELIDLGFDDTMRREEEITRFFLEE